MRFLVGVLTLGLVATLSGLAHGLTAGEPVADLGISFVVERGLPLSSGSEAFLDTDRMTASWSRAPRTRRGVSPSAVVEHRVGVRIASRSGRRGFARLRACLEVEEPRAIVSVDGQVLTTAPRLVDAQAPLGSTVSRRITVEVPASEPPGPFTARILWEVEEP